jgi:hypothetical protein
MPLKTYTNDNQSLQLLDLLQGNGEAVTCRINFPPADELTRILTIQITLDRVPGAGEDPSMVDTMTAWLGSGPFLGDLAQRTVDPEFLVAGQPQPVTLAFDFDLPAALAGVAWFTLFHPVEGLVSTGHVPASTAVFGPGQFKNRSETVTGTLPLRLTVRAYGPRPATQGDVTGLAEANHPLFDSYLRVGLLHKKTRIQVYRVDFGLTSPPFRTAAELPQVTLLQTLYEGIDYSITQTDQFQADGLTVNMTLEMYHFHADVLQENAMLTVDERWSTPSIGGNSGWIRLGTYFLDRVTDNGSQGGRRVDLVARDPLKLLAVNSIEERYWPDKIFVPRKRLVQVRDGFRDQLPYHIFTDGPETAHTVLWVTTPSPKLWAEATPRRIRTQEGSLELLARNGELQIEREYYKARLDEGGLANPRWLEAEYYRWAQPADEVLTHVTQVGSFFVRVQGPVTDRWKGTTLIMLDGAARHTRYQVSGVAVPLNVLQTAGRNPLADGVAVGDRVQVVYANRVEDVVRRVFLTCGFQDLDPGQPFYIEQIAKPSVNPIQIPGTDEFDFRHDRTQSAFNVMEQVRQQIPPNILYRTDALGNVITVTELQSPTGSYSLQDSPSVQEDRSELDIATRVIYRARDRSLKNAVAYTSPVLASVDVPTTLITLPGGGRQSLTSLLHVGPEGYLKQLSLVERAKRAVVDGSRNTRAAWAYDVNPASGGAADYVHLNDVVLMQWNFTQPIRIKEVHLRAYQASWIISLYMDLEGSEDGAEWRTLTDEFTFGSPSDTLRVFQLNPIPEVQHLRLKVTSGARVLNADEKPKQIAGGLADLFVFTDDVVEGVAELGVDRLPGSTDADFARDQEARQRLRRRTKVVEPIDEQGYEISAAMGISLADYVRARALEYLAEYSTAFTTLKVEAVRPDLGIGDSVAAAAARLALPGSSYLVRESSRSASGELTTTLTNFRPVDVSQSSTQSTHPPNGNQPGLLASG